MKQKINMYLLVLCIFAFMLSGFLAAMLVRNSNKITIADIHVNYHALAHISNNFYIMQFDDGFDKYSENVMILTQLVTLMRLSSSRNRNVRLYFACLHLLKTMLIQGAREEIISNVYVLHTIFMSMFNAHSNNERDLLYESIEQLTDTLRTLAFFQQVSEDIISWEGGWP